MDTFPIIFQIILWLLLALLLIPAMCLLTEADEMNKRARRRQAEMDKIVGGNIRREISAKYLSQDSTAPQTTGSKQRPIPIPGIQQPPESGRGSE